MNASFAGVLVMFASTSVLATFLFSIPHVALSQEAPRNELPVESVSFGAEEVVTLRVRVRESSWVIGRELAPLYDEYAERARAGDAAVAENLYTAVSQCENAPRSEEELDAAVDLMRRERRQVLANGVTAQIESDAETEDLVSQIVVYPYEACKGLPDDQRKSAQDWLRLAVDLGSADAAMASLQTASEPSEQQRLLAIIWQAGEPDALGGLANFYEQRSKSSDARSDDMLQAYAHFFAMNEVAKFFARNYPPAPIRSRLHAKIAAELDRIGSSLSADERDAGAKMAAELVRSNPNCCDVL